MGFLAQNIQVMQLIRKLTDYQLFLMSFKKWTGGGPLTGMCGENSHMLFFPAWLEEGTIRKYLRGAYDQRMQVNG